MKKDIVIPAAGESVTEADIVSWYKQSGDYVEMDENEFWEIADTFRDPNIWWIMIT